MEKVKWGILGAGNIAHAFAKALPLSESGVLAGVGSRSLKKAEAFLEKHGVGEAFGSYEELLSNSSIDAVYICTPHPMHMEWTIKAAEAGKHVLCEKPMAVNAQDAEKMINVAQDAGVFLMEAFMYRSSEQVAKVCELIKEKAIGEVRLIKGSFGFKGAYDLEGRLLNRDLAGGGILDVGCYPVSMARLLAGVAQGRPFSDPVELQGMAYIGKDSQCDEWAVASLDFGDGVMAQCSTGVQLDLDNIVQVFGSEGSIDILSPWFCGGREGGTSEILLKKRNETENIQVENTPLYSAEIDAMAKGISGGRAPWPAMSLEDSLGNMKALDCWRREIGLSFPQDKTSAL